MPFPTISSMACEAARNSVACFDLSQRGKIILRGSDRTSFLQNYTTQDVLKLKPGEGCETFITTHQGKVVAWVQVMMFEEYLYLHLDPGYSGKVIKHLSKYQINEVVEFEDRTQADAMWLVVGPNTALPANQTLSNYQCTQLDRSLYSLLIQRLDHWGIPGYLTVLPQNQSEGYYSELLAQQIVPGEAIALESLRIEAGTPMYGVDFDETNLPQEVNRTEQAISYTKGCYLGQEPITRIMALGHVNKTLQRVRLEAGDFGNTEVEPGCLLFRDGKEAGKITSIAWSPNEKRYLALAMVRRGYLEKGIPFLVQNNQGQSIDSAELI